MLRVWDVTLNEGMKVIHRTGIALLKICEPQLMQCSDQQQMLCLLQSETASCHDVSRLFALAFDTIGPVPRERLEILRKNSTAELEADPACARWDGLGGRCASGSEAGDGGIEQNDDGGATSSSESASHLDGPWTNWNTFAFVSRDDLSGEVII